MGNQSVSAFRRRRVALFAAAFVATFLLLTIGLYAGHGLMGFLSSFSELKSISNMAENGNISFPHRKLLEQDKKVVPNRIWSDKCSPSDIVISQGPTAPLPNGIPTYTVEIMNVCPSGCDIAGIHLRCGWFSSARLVNPHIFKRLQFNDCLVNDGKPLRNGRTLSFKYANTFPYNLAVATVNC